MKLIIAGTRAFNRYDILKKYVEEYIEKHQGKEIEIVSGHAEGADKLGEKFAEEKGYPLTIFRANWDKYGRAAGPIRNEEMAKYATHCIIFWDGKSPGTRNMNHLASAYDLYPTTILYENIIKNEHKRRETGGSSSGIFELS